MMIGCWAVGLLFCGILLYTRKAAERGKDTPAAAEHSGAVHDAKGGADGPARGQMKP